MDGALEILFFKGLTFYLNLTIGKASVMLFTNTSKLTDKTIKCRILDPMIFSSVKIEISSKNRKEFILTVRSLLEHIKQQKGCLSCRLYQDFGNENTFVLYAEWESQLDLEHHFESDDFGVLLGASKIFNESQLKIKFGEFAYNTGLEVVESIRGKYK